MRYDEASKKLVLALKRADRLDLSPAFARWLERSGRSLLDEADLIVPVPLHRLRLWRRRYNQAAVMALGLSRSAGVAYAPLLLQRLRATPSQGAMPSAKARRRNMLGAFAVPKPRRGEVKGRNSAAGGRCSDHRRDAGCLRPGPEKGRGGKGFGADAGARCACGAGRDMILQDSRSRV